MAEAIYRKYRPMTFADVTGQGHVKHIIQNQIAQNLLSHAYLFSGPRGVGKTTIARLLAKAVNCEQRKEGDSEPCNACGNCTEMNSGTNFDIVEIDAASNTGVDHVRENIIEAARFSPNKAHYKVFIIDEVHMLSKSAFNALLKTLEEPPKYVIFVLATTELHKIPPTILSRCMRFNFTRIPSDIMVERLQMISKAESVTLEPTVALHVARLSEGCLRDAESLLNQLLSLGDASITEESASTVLPIALFKTVEDVILALRTQDHQAILKLLGDFTATGGSPERLVKELVDYVRGMLFLMLGSSVDDAFTGMEGRMQTNASAFGTARLTALLKLLIKASKEYHYDPLPQLPLELALIAFCLDGKESPAVQIAPPAPKSQPAPEPAPKPALPAAPAPPAPHAPASEPTAQEATSEATITVEEAQNKWKRCTDALAKRNIALPLALQNASPTAISNGELTLTFTHEFHFETINKPKNLELISEAVFEVLQTKFRIKAIYQKPPEEQTIDALVEAFGGNVID